MSTMRSPLASTTPNSKSRELAKTLSSPREPSSSERGYKTPQQAFESSNRQQIGQPFSARGRKQSGWDSQISPKPPYVNPTDQRFVGNPVSARRKRQSVWGADEQLIIPKLPPAVHGLSPEMTAGGATPRRSPVPSGEGRSKSPPLLPFGGRRLLHRQRSPHDRPVTTGNSWKDLMGVHIGRFEGVPSEKLTRYPELSLSTLDDDDAPTSFLPTALTDEQKQSVRPLFSIDVDRLVFEKASLSTSLPFNTAPRKARVMQQAQTAREASGRDQVFWNKRGRKVPTLALGSSSWEKGMTGVGSDETVVEIGPRDPLAPFSPNPPLGGSPKHDGIRLQNRRVKPMQSSMLCNNEVPDMFLLALHRNLGYSHPATISATEWMKRNLRAPKGVEFLQQR